jgi:hypothetical protein
MFQTKNDQNLRVTLLANALLLIIGSLAHMADSMAGNILLIGVFVTWILVFAWYAGSSKLAAVAARDDE